MTDPATSNVPSFEELQRCARAMFEADFRGEGDFTLFYLDNDIRAKGPDPLFGSLPDKDWWYCYCCKQVQKPCVSKKHITSFEFQETVHSKSARLQVSRAQKATGWSVTVRWSPPNAIRTAANAYLATRVAARRAYLPDSPWKPSEVGEVLDESDNPAEYFLFAIKDVVEVLYRLIVTPEKRVHGLVLITGSTNAAKSECARGLIWRYFEELVEEERRLHLVTYEDPIEKEFAPKGATGVPSTFEVTQRSARHDCRSLEEALKAALRQTPDVFYIGEIRSEPDLLRALQFGGTGHLVFATAHAGSLLEAVTKLLKAARWETLGSRAIHIPKILSVIHLKTFLVAPSPREPFSASALVPSLYRRTSTGVQDLVSEGLASILPHFPDSPNGDRFGSLGRQFVASLLIKESKLLKDVKKWSGPEDAGTAQSNLLQTSLEDDLNA
jgi:hypothetical protein